MRSGGRAVDLQGLRDWIGPFRVQESQRGGAGKPPDLIDSHLQEPFPGDSSRSHYLGISQRKGSILSAQQESQGAGWSSRHNSNSIFILPTHNVTACCRDCSLSVEAVAYVDIP